MIVLIPDIIVLYNNVLYNAATPNLWAAGNAGGLLNQ